MSRTKPDSDTQYSEQNVLNNSYDRDYHVLAVEQLGYDYSTNTLVRVRADTTGLMVQPISFNTDEGTKKLKFNGEAPQVCSQDYLQAIAEGDITAHSLFSKIGYSPSGGTTTTDVWGGGTAYTFPTSAMQMEVVSSSGSDVASSTGANSVRIYYLKSDYTEATTDVTLNGTTAVATTASDIFRINNFRVLDFAASAVNYTAAGNIDVRHLDDTPIYSRIMAGQTKARNSVYTVPNDKVLYLTSMAVGVTKASATGTTGTFTLRATYDDKLPGNLTAGKFFMPYAEINHQDGQATREFHVPLKFPEKTDIKVSVICGQATTVCTSSLRGWLEGATEGTTVPVDTGMSMGLLAALTYQF